MRSMPPHIRRSLEWQRASALLRCVWQDIRPREGFCTIVIAEGTDAAQALMSVLTGYGFDLTYRDVVQLLDEARRIGFIHPGVGEYGPTLEIVAHPPTQEAERLALGRGVRMGMSNKEKVAAWRANQRTASTSSTLPSSPSIPPNAPTPLSSDVPLGSGSVDPPNTLSEGGSAPPFSLSPSLVHRQVNEERGGGVAEVESTRPTSSSSVKPMRSADELGRMAHDKAGATQLGRLVLEWFCDGTEKVFSPAANNNHLEGLGRLVKTRRLDEKALRVLAAAMREVPELMTKALSFSPGVRGGGRISVGLFCGSFKRNEYSGAGLDAAYEASSAWWRGIEASQAKGPGVAKAGTDGAAESVEKIA